MRHCSAGELRRDAAGGSWLAGMDYGAYMRVLSLLGVDPVKSSEYDPHSPHAGASNQPGRSDRPLVHYSATQTHTSYLAPRKLRGAGPLSMDDLPEKRRCAALWRSLSDVLLAAGRDACQPQRSALKGPSNQTASDC